MFRGSAIRRGTVFEPAKRSDQVRDQEFAADAPQPVRWFDRIFFIAYIFVSVASESRDDSAGADASGGGLAAALWAMPYLLAFAAVWLERKTAMRLVRESLPLALVLLIACLSSLWSDAPGTAVQRSVGLVGYTVIALALVCRLGLKGFLETIGLLIVLEAIVSVVLIAFFPDLGVMDDGEWRGLFVNKNELGQSMVLGIVTIACLGEHWRGNRRALQFVTLAVLFALVAGSRSVTSLVIAMILALVLPLGLRRRARRESNASLLPILVPAAAIVAVLFAGLGADGVLGLFGKNASLTGRTSLWEATLAAIGERPFLGYGYGVFWSENGPGNFFMVQHDVLWEPTMAHNGFLEVALSVGLVGVAAIVLLLAAGVKRSAKAFARGSDRIGAWPLFTSLYIVLSNFSEANLERSHNVLWVAFVAAFLFATDACLRSRSPKTTDPAT